MQAVPTPPERGNLVHLKLARGEEREETKNLVQAPPEVYALATYLIEKHSVHVGRLAAANIKFLMSKKTRRRKGAAILGNARAFSEADSLLHPYHFLITLDLDFWDESEARQREALLFHELKHCDFDDDGKAVMVDHDLQEFSAVVRHYGLWKDDVADFSRQLSLGLEGENATIS
jgi:hypothetical protein